MAAERLFSLSSGAPWRKRLAPSPASIGVLVWGFWLAMTVYDLAYVASYGSEVPWFDEWDSLVPIVTARAPVAWESLWAPHNEHRLVVPKLIWLGAIAPMKSIHTGTYLNVAALAAAAAAMTETARRLRGRLVVSDAVFTALLLHLGHAENLLWPFQLQFVLVPLLAVGSWCATVLDDGRLAPKWLALGAACLFALPLTLAGGVIIAPILGLPFLWAGLVGLRDGRAPRLRCASAAGVGAATIAIAAACFVDRADHHPAPGSMANMAADVPRILAISFGPGPKYSRWPLPGAVAFLALATAAAVRCCFGDRAQRARGFAIIAFLLAFVALGCGIAYGRSGLGTAAVISDRYAVLMCPVLCMAYVALDVCSGAHCAAMQNGSRWFRAAAVALAIPAVATIFSNDSHGRGMTLPSSYLKQHFLRDLRAGMPLDALLAEHGTTVHVSRAQVERGLIRLRQAGFAEYGRLKIDDP